MTPSTMPISSGEFVAILVMVVATSVFMTVCMWAIYNKAGEAGWKSIIPVYNLYVLFQIVGKPGWWVIFLFVPFVGTILFIFMNYLLARAFGKGVGYMLGVTFLPFIFLPLLAFGGAQYQPMEIVK